MHSAVSQDTLTNDEECEPEHHGVDEETTHLSMGYMAAILGRQTFWK